MIVLLTVFKQTFECLCVTKSISCIFIHTYAISIAIKSIQILIIRRYGNSQIVRHQNGCPKKCPSLPTDTISKKSGKKDYVINNRKAVWRWATNSTSWANLKFKRFMTFKLKPRCFHVEYRYEHSNIFGSFCHLNHLPLALIGHLTMTISYLTMNATIVIKLKLTLTNLMYKAISFYLHSVHQQLLSNLKRQESQ